MTLLEFVESVGASAKIQRKGGMWRIALYRNRKRIKLYEHRELRGACALALGSSVPTDAP